MQMIGIHTIEDCLEVLAGLQKHNLEFKIESSDATIMYSIARQVFKGTALTDRQYNLMKEKLQNYKPQFEQQDIIGFDRAVDKLRQPLRKIDRSKYIKIVDYPDDIVYEGSDKDKFIKIRFPFKKSDIQLINEINSTPDYYHSKGSHEHYFALTEKNVFNTINKFKDKEYEIDQELLEIYNQITDIKENKQEYVCGIFDDTLLNLHSRIEKIAKDEIGNYHDNKLLYIDRKFRYGIDHIENKTPESLEEKLAFRSNISYQSKPSLESFSDIMSALWNLNRFPLLVILDREHAETQLHEMITFYRDILSSEEQSVLFRQDNDSGFNQLIKDRKLNNWVDKNTKIVYISNDKLPKLLLNTDFQPFTTFSYTSSTGTNVDTYASFNCDLIVFREEELSPLRRYSRYYG